MRICFVCTGNICRSPYAEGLLRHRARTECPAETWAAGLEVLSAGLLDLGERPAHPWVRVLAEARGFSIEAHHARPLAAADLPSCDLILGMAPEHVEHVRDLLPAVAERTFLLTAYPAPGLDTPAIPDPMGQSDEDFVNSCVAIETGIASLLAALRSGNQARA